MRQRATYAETLVASDEVRRRGCAQRHVVVRLRHVRRPAIDNVRNEAAEHGEARSKEEDVEAPRL